MFWSDVLLTKEFFRATRYPLQHLSHVPRLFFILLVLIKPEPHLKQFGILNILKASEGIKAPVKGRSPQIVSLCAVINAPTAGVAIKPV